MHKIRETLIGMSYEEWCNTYVLPDGSTCTTLSMQARNLARTWQYIIHMEKKVASESFFYVLRNDETEGGL